MILHIKQPSCFASSDNVVIGKVGRLRFTPLGVEKPKPSYGDG